MGLWACGAHQAHKHGEAEYADHAGYEDTVERAHEVVLSWRQTGVNGGAAVQFAEPRSISAFGEVRQWIF